MMTEQKVALVTGGSRGIGKAIVLTLAKAGFHVAFTFHSNAGAAEAVATEARAFGVTVEALQSDASNPEAAKALIDDVVAKLGRLDVLVNNAGITRDTLLIRMSDADWDSVLATNLTGVFHTTRAAAKVMMKARSGHIINISSVVGVFGNAGQANYAAAKAGLIGFTKTVAKELGARGVTVNAIAPGFVETDMTDELKPEVKQGIVDRIAVKRLGQPEDIANAVLFLATQGGYITGQTLQVDGGLVL